MQNKNQLNTVFMTLGIYWSKTLASVILHKTVICLKISFLKSKASTISNI